MVKIRTKKGKNGRTYRYPIKNGGSSDYIQKAVKHPGRVREIIQRWYGKDGFDSKGRIKPEYLIKAKQKAKEEHNRSLEDAIDLAIRLKKIDKPFGVPRQLAYEDVVALRNKGERARLIETNRRLDLYAPYESVLPPEDTEEKHLKDDVEQFNSVVKSAMEKDKYTAAGDKDGRAKRITYREAYEKMPLVPIDIRLSGDTRKGKIYAAVITGTDPKYGLKREFLKGDRTYTGKHDLTIDYTAKLKPGTIIETGEGGSWKNSYGNYYIITKNGLQPFKSNYNGEGKLNIKDLMKAREKAMNKSS